MMKNNEFNLNEINELVDKHFIDKTNETQHVIPASIKHSDNIKKYNYDFTDLEKISEKFWFERDKKFLEMYTKGGIIASIAKQNKNDYGNFLIRFIDTLEEVIKQVLDEKDMTSEEFRDDFKTINHLIRMIINHLVEKTQRQNIDIRMFLSIFNGLINKYIENIEKD